MENKIIVYSRIKISDGLRVLDLGCGWGSCGLYLLEKYPNIHVTFFSNSRTQQVIKKHSFLASIIQIQEHIRNEARKGGNEKRIRSITGDVNVTDILDQDGKVRISLKQYYNLYSASWIRQNRDKRNVRAHEKLRSSFRKSLKMAQTRNWSSFHPCLLPQKLSLSV